MSQLTDAVPAVESTHERRSLAQLTGALGLVTLFVVLGASLVNNYQSASFKSSGNQTVVFFRSIDDGLGHFSSFATAVGLIAMLWFALGLALLLRRYEGELPWRSVFLAGAGIIAVVPGQSANWDAAAYRSGDIDSQVARYAFDLGNLSFANGWVSAGAVGICFGLIVLRSRELTHWLGWWGLIAGIGSVLARSVWSEGYAFIPFALFWVWVGVLSVALLTGRFAVTGDAK